MSPEYRYSDYDQIARIYNEQWGPLFGPVALLSLERILLPHLTQGARILDLCCGAGQLAAMLLERGYKVTGVDGSRALLDYARANAAGAEFVLGDARSLSLSRRFHAVVSTSDSLNHVMSLEELKAVFSNVFSMLDAGGYFVFDVTFEERYRKAWRAPFGVATDDYAWIGEGSYDQAKKRARFCITLFQRAEDGAWSRADVTLSQRCYGESDIRSALAGVGFAAPRSYDGERDLGIAGQAGRTYFVCLK